MDWLWDTFGFTGSPREFHPTVTAKHPHIIVCFPWDSKFLLFILNFFGYKKPSSSPLHLHPLFWMLAMPAGIFLRLEKSFSKWLGVCEASYKAELSLEKASFFQTTHNPWSMITLINQTIFPHPFDFALVRQLSYNLACHWAQGDPILTGTWYGLQDTWGHNRIQGQDLLFHIVSALHLPHPLLEKLVALAKMQFHIIQSFFQCFSPNIYPIWQPHI